MESESTQHYIRSFRERGKCFLIHSRPKDHATADAEARVRVQSSTSVRRFNQRQTASAVGLLNRGGPTIVGPPKKTRPIGCVMAPALAASSIIFERLRNGSYKSMTKRVPHEPDRAGLGHNDSISAVKSSWATLLTCSRLSHRTTGLGKFLLKRN